MVRQIRVAAGLAIMSWALGWSQAGNDAPDPWRASKQYYAELGRQCPQKHLDLFPYGDLPDVIDQFGKRLSREEWQRIKKAEAERCGPDAMGASCGNEGFLRVMVKQKRLGQFVTFVCARPEHCTAQSECKQD